MDNINLSMTKGKTYGVIGTNGSGKTMLLRIIAGLVIPDTGEVIVNNKELHKDISFPSNMGIIIERPGFLGHLSGYDNLMYLAKIQNKIDSDKVRSTIRLLGLDPEMKKPVKTYSLGMKQRLGIAQAIMEDPELIILDEPFNGLDESGVKDVRNILLDLKKDGKTIILTSHNIEDIKLLCDKTYKMQTGKIVKEETIKN
ncbi:ABC transporter ATP-binding protein [Anaerosalibacter massiliensis]|uniref:ABC transporter ATP-binding protein n=1 Tax=Anaerosalibacter massiliensis TaxID=1347392 RepID=A0A9X2MH77_9FIRM|nr:ABC transporter ATP-binding protein [Anaerosalibacter massiliensis]MCR2045082.1 ABC transporter ATP-binding protein [Anaerosalibacter massiliensis]